MAWSDNVRCLYCDGKLPLYRKITSGQFCSAVHRKAYWQDQERLAVERLHQTHDSLRAYRSPEALEAILGKPAASEPVSIDKYYFAGEPPDVESKLNADEIARSASNTGNVKFPGFLTEEKPALRAWNALLAAWDVEFAHWPMSKPSIPSCSSERQESSLPTANGIAVPLFQAHGLAAQIRAAAEKAVAIPFITKLIAQVPFAIAPETEELSRAFLESLQAAQSVAEPPAEEAPFPFAERMAALPKIATQPAAFGLRGTPPEPQQSAWTSQNVCCEAAFASPAVQAVTRLAVPAVTRMEPLAVTNAPRAMAARAGVARDAKACDLQGYAQPMELKSASSAPLMNFALAAAASGMQLAAASGDAILNSAGVAPAILNAANSSSAQAHRPTYVASVRVEPSPRSGLPLRRSKPARPHATGRRSTLRSRRSDLNRSSAGEAAGHSVARIGSRHRRALRTSGAECGGNGFAGKPGRSVGRAQ
jgi:hypothetical protein